MSKTQNPITLFQDESNQKQYLLNEVQMHAIFSTLTKVTFMQFRDRLTRELAKCQDHDEVSTLLKANLALVELQKLYHESTQEPEYTLYERGGEYRIIKTYNLDLAKKDAKDLGMMIEIIIQGTEQACKAEITNIADAMSKVDEVRES